MALSTHQKFDISKQLAIAVIHKTFPSQKIEEALRETGKGSKRKRDLLSQVMVYYMIASCFFMNLNLKEVLRCLLEGLRFLSSVSGIKITGKSGNSQARKRLGYEPLEKLYIDIVKPAACSETKGAWYKRWHLVSLDGSTLNVPDEKENKEYFGHPTSYIENRYIYPQLRFVWQKWGRIFCFLPGWGHIEKGRSV